MPEIRPSALRDLADRLQAAASAAKGRGETESAIAMLEAVLVLRTWLDPQTELPPLLSSGNLQRVTGAQLQRRGKAIAKAKAAKSTDRLWQAITESKWGSQERYARERLKVSPGSLSAYRSGNTPVPRSVVIQVEKDLGIGADYWPGSIVD